MPRYILIDSNSGFIFGDTADYAAGQQSGLDPISAARLLDESIGQHGRSYEMIRHDPRTTAAYYRVYRADVGGSDAVAVVQNGQDQEMIDAVERGCEFVGCVLVSDAED
jgi:hypothetical protein